MPRTSTAGACLTMSVNRHRPRKNMHTSSTLLTCLFWCSRSVFLAHIRYDADNLYVAFECSGRFERPRNDNTLSRWERKEGVLESQRTILADDRVAVFVWPPSSEGAYYGIEVNQGGAALAYRVDVGDFEKSGAFDWGWGAISEKLQTRVEIGSETESTTKVLLGLPWNVMGEWRPVETLATENLLEDTDGVLRPHQCFLEAAACYFHLC